VLLQGFGDRLLIEMKKLAPKDIKIKVSLSLPFRIFYLSLPLFVKSTEGCIKTVVLIAWIDYAFRSVNVMGIQKSLSMSLHLTRF